MAEQKVMLVTPEYVAATTGADISDRERVEFLIGEASEMVMDYLGQEFTPENCPVAVKQAVSIMVDGALDESDGDADLKAEQVGDYRVEYAGSANYASGLDLRRVEHLLGMVRGTGRSVITAIAMDGLVSSTDPLAGALVVNR